MIANVEGAAESEGLYAAFWRCAGDAMELVSQKDNFEREVEARVEIEQAEAGNWEEEEVEDWLRREVFREEEEERRRRRRLEEEEEQRKRLRMRSFAMRDPERNLVRC